MKYGSMAITLKLSSNHHNGDFAFLAATEEGMPSVQQNYKGAVHHEYVT